MRFDFPTLSKVSGTLQVLLDLDSKVLLVHRLFALLLARLGRRAPYTPGTERHFEPASSLRSRYCDYDNYVQQDF